MESNHPPKSKIADSEQSREADGETLFRFQTRVHLGRIGTAQSRSYQSARRLQAAYILHIQSDCSNRAQMSLHARALSPSPHAQSSKTLSDMPRHSGTGHAKLEITRSRFQIIRSGTVHKGEFHSLACRSQVDMVEPPPVPG